MRDLLNIVDNTLNEAANPALIQAVEKAGLQTKSKGNLLVGLVQIPDKAKKNECVIQHSAGHFTWAAK